MGERQQKLRAPFFGCSRSSLTTTSPIRVSPPLSMCTFTSWTSSYIVLRPASKALLLSIAFTDESMRAKHTIEITRRYQAVSDVHTDGASFLAQIREFLARQCLFSQACTRPYKCGPPF